MERGGSCQIEKQRGEKELRSNEFESNSNIECRYKCVYMYACFKLPPKSGQVFSVLEISFWMYWRWYMCVCFSMRVYWKKFCSNFNKYMGDIRYLLIREISLYYWINRSKIIVFMIRVFVCLYYYVDLNRLAFTFRFNFPIKCVQKYWIRIANSYPIFVRGKEALVHDLFFPFWNKRQIDRMINVVIFEMIL